MGRPKGSKNSSRKRSYSSKRAVVQQPIVSSLTLSHVGKVLRSNDLGSVQERFEIALALTGTNG